MGQITSSTGLISGLDTESIINQLIAIESRPKTQIEQRNSVLTAQQTAYQTVNAQLLSLRNAASRIVSDDVYDATQSSSSNEAVATVSSSVGAAVGNYSLTVRQLVGSQQTISRGFADNDATFIAPEGGVLTFNRGEARLDRETSLAELNGGAGIERGFVRITDRSGSTAVVDLTSVVTVNDVVDELNRATGVNILAEIDGDSLKITDASGQAANDLIIQDVGSGATATSLGLVGSSNTGELTGTAINTVGKDTYVSSLNDGNGIRSVSGVDDLNITTNGGGSFDINLSNALTLEDVIDTIETATGGDVTATFNTDGTGLTLTDNTGNGPGFAVTGLNDSKAALDLGILGSDDNSDGDIVGNRVISSINSKLLGALRGGRGLLAFGGDPFAPLDTTTNLADLFQGTGVTTVAGNDIDITLRDDADTTFGIDLDGLTTVQDFIDAVDTATSGNATVTIDGQSLVITDNTGGSGNFIVANAGNSSAVSELGLGVNAGVTSVSSRDLDPAGVSGTGAVIDITNSAGSLTSVDLSGAQSIDDILDIINAAGAGVRAELNNAGTGFKLTDTAGGLGDLTIADGTGGVLATQLGLTGVYEDGEVDAGPLGFQYVNEGSRLDNLGITRGRFTIRDSDGRTATVDLTQGNEQTIGDVITEINSRGLAIVARVNDSGDGLILEDTGSGAVGISIAEDGSTTAADLGILGEYAAGANIDGSFRQTITVDSTDTLQSLALKITNAKIGVSATVINDGSPGAPYRLSLSSDKAGTGGAFTLDDGGLGLDVNNVASAQDAVVFYGGDDPASALVVTSRSNTVDNLIDGVSISLLATSDDPIQITISDDPAAITSAAEAFVSSFNGLVDSINEFDSYNAETEERGLLLGDSALSRLRTSIYNAVIGANGGLTGQFNSLAQVGIRVGSGARLQLDNERFQAALASDPDGVRDLFTFQQFEVDPVTGEDTDVVVAQGVGVEIDQLLERLTDSTDGILERQVQILQDQIELNNRRIEQVDQTIAAKQERLQREFNNLEFTLAGLQDQQAALAGLSAQQAQAQQ
ncbi:flagellar filament capping protein FliD [Algisphaera agarilytica]|uniref:Filament cap protein n=1 Tax=Algisphaera agarilytica TaxID=1385975 RepID=A0A7X0HAN3_9BACT|nr:flagellar filament capping protein FliD [Algisphaera agarilytica]MBB6430899.1 flagellar hook-associated protein 2 [Algisphaera agarilytica]